MNEYEHVDEPKAKDKIKAKWKGRFWDMTLKENCDPRRSRN